MKGIRALAAALALVTASPDTLAQAPVKTARVGILLPGTPAATAHLADSLNRGLREHGYVEHQNIVLERRYADGRVERLAGLAAELVDLKVDAIVTSTDAAILAAKNATRRIPIVMANSTDPVGTSLVASLGRPGGNITGLTYNSPEIAGKRLEFLKEIVPGLARVAFLWTPDNRGNALDLEAIQAAGRGLRVQIQPVAVPQSADVESALSALPKERVEAFVIAGPNPVLFVNRKRIVEFAAQNRLPTISAVREFVDDGGLLSYGANNADLYHLAAGYVDKILKGANPGDLPIEQPTKYEMVVNLKTAKALGLAIPPSILARADEVIE